MVVRYTNTLILACVFAQRPRLPFWLIKLVRLGNLLQNLLTLPQQALLPFFLLLLRHFPFCLDSPPSRLLLRPFTLLHQQPIVPGALVSDNPLREYLALASRPEQVSIAVSGDDSVQIAVLANFESVLAGQIRHLRLVFSSYDHGADPRSWPRPTLSFDDFGAVLRLVFE